MKHDIDDDEKIHWTDERVALGFIYWMVALGGGFFFGLFLGDVFKG